MDDRAQVPADAGPAGVPRDAPVSGDPDAARGLARPAPAGGWKRMKQLRLEHPVWTGVGALATIAGVIVTVVAITMGTSPSQSNANNTNKTGAGNNVGNVNGNGNVVNNNISQLPGTPRASVQTQDAPGTNPYHGGWGPDRDLFSINRAADYPVLNSITDNPQFGDERAFVSIKHAQADNKTFSDLMRAEPGDEVEVYTYLQNDCGDGYASNPLSTIHGLAAVLDNSQTGTDISIQITLRAKNTPAVYDGSTVITSVPSRLELVAGSAVMSTGDADFKLDDATFATTGMLLGQFKQDGEYPIGRAPNDSERGAGYFLFHLRVVAI